jgi:hypothetical protein
MMDTQMGHKGQREQRRWVSPRFVRLGGLSQVKGICGPDHLPNNPYCPPS